QHLRRQGASPTLELTRHDRLPSLAAACPACMVRAERARRVPFRPMETQAGRATLTRLPKHGPRWPGDGLQGAFSGRMPGGCYCPLDGETLEAALIAIQYGIQTYTPVVEVYNGA